ncbi:MAG: hypothetical protein IPM51_12175 [Sphingobacteriaceae bacterium]|nr:hypothetical protein [Sphingobacteriaceae bacterium]
MNLKDDIFFKECDFNTILSFANSQTEKTRALRQNSNLKNAPYPLTKNFLQSYYNSRPFSNLKNTFKNVNCAADVYSYFVMTYGFNVGSSGTGTASAAGQSSGLNPFSPFKIDLGFNFGSTGLLLWLLIAGLVVYKVTK